MTTNELERAVIMAARRFREASTTVDLEQASLDLRLAVQAYEASLTPGESEISWHQLAEGDQLKSRKNGRYYPVTSVLKTRKGYEITLAGISNKIIRPTKEEPMATVRRGATGQAVDTLVHVFSSGGG